MARVTGAWPAARDHFLDIEHTAANIHPDDPTLSSAIDGVGRTVAELRGALGAYVAAIGDHSGQLDALGPVRDTVNVKCDNLTTKIQVLNAARTTTG